MHEQEADHVADQVMRMTEPGAKLAQAEEFTTGLPAPPSQLQRECVGCEEEGEEKLQRKEIPEASGPTESAVGELGDGRPLSNAERSFFEPGFGHNFSEVRVHTDAQASRAADSLNAIAFTRGRDIVFAEGQYSSESNAGQRLLAHELVHVGQQRGNLNRAIVHRKITDAELETEFQKWADDKKEKVNKNNVDYAHQLWSFIYDIVGDPQTGGPKAKPQKQADLKKWQEGFEKAELVADWLIKIKKTTTNDSLKNVADSRLSGILDLMRQADLLPAAMSRAGDLESGNKKDLFEAILKSPKSATVNNIERIVSFFCASAKDPADCLVIQTLTDGNDHPIKSSLGVAESKGMVKVLINNYANSSELIDALAELLMFNPKIRNDVSEALMKSELGGSPALLFQILKHYCPNVS